MIDIILFILFVILFIYEYWIIHNLKFILKMNEYDLGYLKGNYDYFIYIINAFHNVK